MPIVGRVHPAKRNAGLAMPVKEGSGAEVSASLGGLGSAAVAHLILRPKSFEVRCVDQREDGATHEERADGWQLHFQRREMVPRVSHILPSLWAPRKWHAAERVPHEFEA